MTSTQQYIESGILLTDPYDTILVKIRPGVHRGQRNFVQNGFIHVISKVFGESRGQLRPLGSAQWNNWETPGDKIND